MIDFIRGRKEGCVIETQMCGINSELTSLW